MEKLYTTLDGIHVLTDPGELSPLHLDSCLVARRKGKLYVHALEGLNGKEVECGRHRSADPVFDYYDGDGEKTERFLILGGVRKDTGFCNLCKDRLNGITGNCFNYDFKPKGCAFDPAKRPGEFRMTLEGWERRHPWEVNKRTPFKKPRSPEFVSFDPKTLRRNRKARKIRANFQIYLNKKEKKYCSRCIFQGLCYMTSVKIAEHCMVTEEKTLKRMVKKIQSKFGSVEEFLSLLAYSGQEIVHRPRGAARKTRWLVSKPMGRNHFLVRKAHRPWKMAKVSRAKVEKKLIPEAPPWENRERIASLAWFFIEKYFPKDSDAYRGYRGRTIRTLSILPVPRGIEVSYYPYGWRLSRHTKILDSFNNVLRFER